jgi:hypothetical protein
MAVRLAAGQVVIWCNELFPGSEVTLLLALKL